MVMITSIAAADTDAAGRPHSQDDFETLRREAVEKRRLVIWDDDGCDMVYYP